MNIRKWDNSQGELSFERVRALFPGGSFYVVKHTHSPGTKFDGGLTRPSTWFVVRGRCILTTAHDKVEIAAGDIVDVEGVHGIEVVDDESIEIAYVCDLRPFIYSAQIE